MNDFLPGNPKLDLSTPVHTPSTGNDSQDPFTKDEDRREVGLVTLKNQQSIGETPISPPIPSPRASDPVSAHELSSQDTSVINAPVDVLKHERDYEIHEDESKRMKLDTDILADNFSSLTDDPVVGLVSKSPITQLQPFSFPKPQPQPQPQSQSQPQPQPHQMKSQPAYQSHSNSLIQSRPHSLSSVSSINGPLPKHQQRHLLASIRSVKRLKDAGPFIIPVDVTQYPNYPNFVKQPMDLTTIEQKLRDDRYNSIEQIVADFELIVSNCTAFNGSAAIISHMARNIQTSFLRHLQSLPPYDAVPQISKKSRKSTPSKPSFKSRKPSGASHNRSNSQSFALQPSGIPTIRRESANDSRPKREIHPPKPKDIPYTDMKPRRKKFAAELKFCGLMLRELQNKRHETYSFPFIQPVDPVALDCPTYFKVIKEPMDLSTIAGKYHSNQYENAKEFEDDIRLMFRNCYKFNPEGTPVNMMGHRLEAVFDKKWVEKPLPALSPPPILEDSGSDDDFDGSDLDFDETTVTNPAIQFLERQLERMRMDLIKMKKEQFELMKKQRMKKRKAAKQNDRRKSSISAIGKHKTNKSVAPIHVTYEMKKELSDKISVLPEKKLMHVVDIINESMPDLKSNGDDEIELDIDQLDPSTVLRLYQYVVRKIDRAPQQTSPQHNPKPRNKKKAKPLSEAEQNSKIEQIQKQIKAFDRVRNGGEADINSSDDSSDDGELSDESSSEEE